MALITVFVAFYAVEKYTNLVCVWKYRFRKFLLLHICICICAYLQMCIFDYEWKPTWALFKYFR